MGKIIVGYLVEDWEFRTRFVLRLKPGRNVRWGRGCTAYKKHQVLLLPGRPDNRGGPGKNSKLGPQPLPQRTASMILALFFVPIVLLGPLTRRGSGANCLLAPHRWAAPTPPDVPLRDFVEQIHFCPFQRFLFLSLQELPKMKQ